MPQRDSPVNAPPLASAPDTRNSGDVDAIKTVIQIAGEDVRQVYIKVTAVIGLATLLLTQLPFNDLKRMSPWGRWVLMGALVTAGISAGLNFWYLSKLHLARLDMAENLRTGNADATKRLWSGGGTFWRKYRWMNRVGDLFFALSVLAFIAVLGSLLHLHL
jgi:hypothetical protein